MFLVRYARRIAQAVMLFGFGLLSVQACATSSATTRSSKDVAAGQPYVVLVSFDAFRHDYIDRFHPRAFEEIARTGVRSDGLIPSFPSKTFPNHYTLVTGLYPGHHGIVGNTFYSPSRNAWYRNSDSVSMRDSSWYSGEPIWVTAERSGVKSATYFWPGSEAAIGGMRPSYWKKYDGKVPNSARVDGVVEWLRLPAAQRPHLALLYVSTVDDTTHRYGPDDPHTAGAVAEADRTLRQLLDSIHALPFGDSVNVVVVSDHGMARTPPDQVVPIADLLVQNGIDTTSLLMSDNGPALSLWFGGDTVRARRANMQLGRVMLHARSYMRSEIPAEWHAHGNTGFGDLLIVAEEGFILQRRSGDKPPSLGNHGYEPTVHSMRGIFLAAGPQVRAAGIVPPIENVNVYPFVAALLRLERIPSVDGLLDRSLINP